jgi:hypothetical protein
MCARTRFVRAAGSAGVVGSGALDKTQHVTDTSWVGHGAPTSWRWQRSRTLTAAVLAAVTVLDYLMWLAWDQARDVHPISGRETGPYEPWQVIGVSVVALALALMAGWLRRPLVGIVVVPAVFTACWILDSATEQTPDANLWPIGAAFLATGCLLGVTVFAAAGFATRVVRDRRKAST